MACFPPSKEEALIDAVERRRTLYDKSDKNYSNRDFVGKMWREVAEEIDYEASSCKVKWQSLRDYFLRKRKENTKKSGQAACNKREWRLYERMSFLNPFTFVTARINSGNLDTASIKEESDVTVFNIQADTDSDSQRSISPFSQEASIEEDATSSFSAGPPRTPKSNSGGKKRKMNYQENYKEPDNEHELFFKSLIPTVSQFDSIQTMLFRAEVQHLAVKYLQQQRARASRSPTPASFSHREAVDEQR